MDRKLRKSLLMKILYSMGKGQGALSRKGHEGPRGFLSPWGQWSQVLQKTAWKDSSGKNCLPPACLPAGPAPRRDVAAPQGREPPVPMQMSF